MAQSSPGRGYYIEVSESIKSVYELTTRVDERVKSIMEKQAEMSTKLDNQLQMDNELDTRLCLVERKEIEVTREDIAALLASIHKLEGRVQACEFITTRQESRWKIWLDVFLRIAILVAASSIATWFLIQTGLR